MSWTGALSRYSVCGSLVPSWAILDPALQHYYHAATTILVYDYYLTFGDEVRMIPWVSRHAYNPDTA
jgi:hypothetical protein